MRRFFRILIGIAVVIAAAAFATMFFTSGARDSARSFVLNASSGSFAEARAALHPELQKDWTEAKFAEVFAGSKPYTEVKFGSISAGTGKATELGGTAKTADGCESVLTFEIMDAGIILFDISPLCRE